VARQVDPRRARDAELSEPPSHHRLALSVPQGGCPGANQHAIGGQRLDVRARHVLVIEGDDVAARGKGPKIR
jgi:hypothetical protein